MTNNNNQVEKIEYEKYSIVDEISLQLVKCGKCGQSFPSESIKVHKKFCRNNK